MLWQYDFLSTMFKFKKKLPPPKPIKMVPCIECQGMVSEKAIRCPHCSLSPRGRRCCICWHIDKPSLLQPITTRTPSAPMARHIVTALVHPTCLEQVSQTPQRYKCEVCDTETNFPVSNRALHCPKCGHAVPVTYCRSCGLPVISQKSHQLQYRYLAKNQNGIGAPAHLTVRGCFHVLCQANLQAEAVRVQEARRTRGVCTYCGGAVEPLERFFLKRHHHCDVFCFDRKPQS